MRTSAPTPTVDPLPYFSHDSGPDGLVEIRGTAGLRSEAIARFDALLHEIHPDAARVDPDRLQHLVNWLLALPADNAHDAIERRLQRTEALRAMLVDADWNTDPATRARTLKLLAYIDRDDDLIADHEPLLGLLDDVLLIELSWPAFADEADEYRDFCAYRDDQHPRGNGQARRSAWVRDRVAEIALWQHHLRVNGSHYAHSGDPPTRFRVS